MNRDTKLHKTQCQLCKRLAWPIIAHSVSGLVWKWVSPMEVITMVYGACILGMVTPNRTNNQPTG